MADTRIKGLTQQTTMSSSDVLIVDNTSGTKGITFSNLFKNVIANNAGGHNSIFRGKSLGTSVTAAQYAAIKAGTFDDLFIGDYWTINSVNYRIAHFDYYYNIGATQCTTHHAVIVPDSCLTSKQMNSTNTTTGGYVGSEMHTTNLADAKTAINNAFSGHVLTVNILLTNAVSNGYPSAGTWVSSTVELMSERMVYGATVFAPNSNGSTIPYNYNCEFTQLALFALAPQYITNRTSWWLRDVASAVAFAFVASGGYASGNGASGATGVRPAFCIS